MPDAPSRPGLIFMGWTDGSVTHQAGEKIEVSSDLSFKSSWANLPDIEPDEPDKPVEPELPFYDVNANDWFFDAVCSVYYADLMNLSLIHIWTWVCPRARWATPRSATPTSARAAWCTRTCPG